MGRRLDQVFDILVELFSERVHVSLSLGAHVLVDGCLELATGQCHGGFAPLFGVCIAIEYRIQHAARCTVIDEACGNAVAAGTA
jgi:hypothetical protein